MSELPLLQLPLHIIINILGHLNFTDLRNVMLTCKYLRDLIVNERSIWRMVCHNKLIIQDADNSQTFPLSLIQRSNSLNAIQRTRISLNWARGVYRSKVILYHKTKFMPWLKVYKSDSLFVSTGSLLKCYPMDINCFPAYRNMLWNLETPFVKRNDVRTNDISRFVVKDDIIVCGNRDGCVSVYKIENLNQTPRLLHHIRDCHDDGRVEVTDVEFINSNHKPYVITGSSACSKLCFWCLTSEGSDSIHDVNYHLESVKCTSKVNLGAGIGVRCIAANSYDDKLAIGLNGNSKPLLLDVETGRLLLNTNAMENTKHAVRDVGWHNKNTIMYVTHSGVLQFIDMRSGNVVYNMMDPFQSTLYCVKSDNHNAVVVGTAEYCRCVLFDTRKSTSHVQLFFTQKKTSPVYSLDFDVRKLLAAADQSVGILNFAIRYGSVIPQDYSAPFEFVT